MEEPKVKIVYVGKKPYCADNVSGSRKIWRGTGDVQEVTIAQAKQLQKFPDQWEVSAQNEAEVLKSLGVGNAECGMRNAAKAASAVNIVGQGTVDSEPLKTAPHPRPSQGTAKSKNLLLAEKDSKKSVAEPHDFLGERQEGEIAIKAPQVVPSMAELRGMKKEGLILVAKNLFGITLEESLNRNQALAAVRSLMKEGKP